MGERSRLTIPSRFSDAYSYMRRFLRSRSRLRSSSTQKSRTESSLRYGLDNATPDLALIAQRARAFGFIAMAAVFGFALIPAMLRGSFELAGIALGVLLLTAVGMLVTYRLSAGIVRGACHLGIGLTLVATIVGAMELGGANSISITIPILLVLFASHVLGVGAAAFWTGACLLGMSWVVLLSSAPISGPDVTVGTPGSIWMIRAAVLVTAFSLATAGRRFADRQGTELRFQARHDSLTHLLNRAEFDRQLYDAISRSRRYKRGLALLFIDLGGLKQINDQQGHRTGDAVLRELAGRLRSSTRETDLVARMGGHEMVVVLEPINDAKNAEIYAQRLLSKLSAPIEAPSSLLEISVSLGLAMFPEDADEDRGLLHLADLAMRQAKSTGGDRVQVYSALGAIERGRS